MLVIIQIDCWEINVKTMEQLKKLKPVHLYLIGALTVNIGVSLENSPILHYSLFILGASLVIFGIVKHFRE